MSQNLPSPFTLFTQPLLKQIETIFWNYEDTPFCYPEISHRSKQYAQINEQSMSMLRKYYQVPENFHILYLPIDCGHPSIPFNLNIITNNRAFYVVTDLQSEHAYRQALKINAATSKIDNMEDRKSVIQPLGQPFYFYTFYSKLSLQSGEFINPPQPLDGQILVCSISNCSYYQEIDISKHGIVFFQTGRGIGLTGMSVVFIRQDLFGKQMNSCPDMMCYQKTLQMNSIVNTPYNFITLFIREQIKLYLEQEYSLQKAKDELKAIKQDYETQLTKYTEVAHTAAEGMIKFKLPPDYDNQSAQQYGILRGNWLIVMIQPVNKGKEMQLASKLFK